MIKMRTLLLMLLVLSLGFGCACNKKKGETEPVSDDLKTSLAEQNNAFAFELYRLADQPGKNLFYSPYSITSALSMVYGGAQGNTAVQMAEAMKFDLPAAQQHQAYLGLQQSLNAIGSQGKAELNVANALFGADSNAKLIEPDYLALLRESYLSDLYSLDFTDFSGTAQFINRWVEEKTKDRIKDLVNEGHIRDSNEGLVLVNAIYFKGSWLNEFEPKLTFQDKFYVSSTERTEENSRPVDMMTARAEYPYAQLDGLQILELPYAEEELAMMFVLPDEIANMDKDLNTESYGQWQEALSPQEVKIYIPKFKFDLTLDGLADMLKKLGMTDAFNLNLANFNGIIPDETGRGLYISDVIHKAFVEVNEEGTEAAAATGIVMATKAGPGPDQTPVFRADKPFLYLLVHKPTNTVLFMGKMCEPPKM
ncbi:MAG: serpin family protein [Candidatus Cloacimonetes bacterium]|nr:serpin family protein [Candidatus Cloacimonadota bacterium]